MGYLRRVLFYMSFTVAALFVFAACSKNIQNVPDYSRVYEKEYDTYVVEEESIEDFFLEDFIPEDFTTEDFTTENFDSQDFGSMHIENVKIIKTGNIDMETKDFDGLEEYMRGLLNSVGGYVESSNLHYNHSGFRIANYCLRVPSANFDTAVNSIMSMGNVISSSTAATDVTERYMDIGARLITKETEEQRLLELIDKTDGMSDLIKLEQRLSSVRTDIELYKSHQRDIDKKSSYSTVWLYVTEIIDIYKSETLWGKLEKAFKESVDGIMEFFQLALVFLVSALVPCLFIAVFLYIGRRILKRMWRRRVKKPVAERNQKNKSDI